ncbi:MAG: hypothetical protein H0T76_23465 [Nannocystis sp.]|nr:hypothetical protein [Nannocystis sp.]MBA3549445.1 hypothetical protein [Nannocystis sp.]
MTNPVTMTMTVGDTGDSSPTSGETSDTTPTTGGDPTEDPTGEPMDEPHALGTILLGESHPAVAGNTTPFVSASFIPDVDGGGGGGAACTESVAGCQIALIPDCNDSCEFDQFCGFDAGCQPTCQAVCDAQCAQGEVCYFPAPNTPGCKKLETFDAGALTFIGTPLPITLFPPYSFMSEANASPFAPGGVAKIQATGASGAGYEKFEKEFTGTDFMQTSPKLSTIGFAEVFGAGPLPVKWTPGKGQVTITATVQSADFKFGTITCKADDASGGFDVPREALKAAIDGGDISNLTVSVQRQRTDLFKDLTTKGELTGVTVQPIGFLQIITSSTEFHAFQGCSQGEAVCNNECVDVQFDTANCGGCGKTCVAGDDCDSGTCTGQGACIACDTAAMTGACKAENAACDADPECGKFEDCYDKCQTQACVDDTCIPLLLDQSDFDLFNAQFECTCGSCFDECAQFC